MLLGSRDFKSRGLRRTIGKSSDPIACSRALLLGTGVFNRGRLKRTIGKSSDPFGRHNHQYSCNAVGAGFFNCGG